ncbi:leucine-rich repeat-containing protein 46 [Sorex araneus]|uniref:leucine-rich repeat-containing protein 46 n=1 Tax=Sorex araneus TaxID=42254 RepID=UPI002433DB1A|nr:leucine-rich repeat-containing protein 46 [Sorex araneus]
MMPGDESSQSSEESGVCITEDLIIKRNLSFPEDEDLSEKIFHSLAELQTVRLDREGITTIMNLERLQNLHSLYLQGNKIRRIENLSCIPFLRFLSLSGNLIKQVENLRDLPHLQFLDLSENQIATLQLDEFPQCLLILNLTGNGCTNLDGYRKQVVRALPLLLDLDGEQIMERWTSDDEDRNSEEGDVNKDDQEYPELSGPFSTERGFFRELEQEMARHRERREREALMEHQLRMDTQPVLTNLPTLFPGPSADQNNAAVAPDGGQETAPEPTSESPTTSSHRHSSQRSRNQPSSEQARKGSKTASGAKTSPVGHLLQPQ